MYYELQRNHISGEWWIIRQEEDGYRTVIATLSPDLDISQANRYMDAYLVEVENG